MGKVSRLSPRERVLLALDHQETDQIPLNSGVVNPPAKEGLRNYFGFKTIAEVDQYLKTYSDIRTVEAKYIGPEKRNKIRDDGTIIDVWGVERKPFSYGAGEYEEIFYYPLAEVKDIDDLDKYEWPVADWWDFSVLPAKIKKVNAEQEYAIMAGHGNLFESAWYMRGFEQMFVDFMEKSELAWEIMKRVTDYYISFFKRLLEKNDNLIDVVFTADDLGTQRGPLMSVDLWKKMIKPHHVRLNKVIHEFDVKIMYHSCGAIMKMVPELIDMGIDILQPLQFDAEGMDPVELKNKYGDRLTFHGGVSVQSTLPDGTVDEVIAETKARIDVLGKNGGYILAPSQAVQAGTPPENIVAFLETGRKYYFK